MSGHAQGAADWLAIEPGQQFSSSFFLDGDVNEDSTMTLLVCLGVANDPTCTRCEAQRKPGDCAVLSGGG